MLYSIINMSDPYTMEADDICVAAFVCAVLGSGQYALTPIDDNCIKIPDVEGVPFFMMGTSIEKWFSDHGVPDISNFKETQSEKIADAFDSVVIGSRKEYLEMRKLISEDKLAEFDEQWLESKRSSMNNIGLRAKRNAAIWRNQTDDAPPAVPRNVF